MLKFAVILWRFHQEIRKIECIVFFEKQNRYNYTKCAFPYIVLIIYCNPYLSTYMLVSNHNTAKFIINLTESIEGCFSAVQRCFTAFPQAKSS